MNRRIRKKRRVGEFNWEGFEVEATFDPPLQDVDKFLDGHRPAIDLAHERKAVQGAGEMNRHDGLANAKDVEAMRARKVLALDAERATAKAETKRNGRGRSSRADLRRRKAREAAHQKAFRLVKKVLDELDPEGFLKMGAPKDEYSSEAHSLALALARGQRISAEYVRDVWLYWFGCGEEVDSGRVHVGKVDMRAVFWDVAERIRLRSASMRRR